MPSVTLLAVNREVGAELSGFKTLNSVGSRDIRSSIVGVLSGKGEAEAVSSAADADKPSEVKGCVGLKFDDGAAR